MVRYSKIILFVLLLALIYFSFYTLKPQYNASKSISKTAFSTTRALEPLKTISAQPHFLGSDAHSQVRDFLVAQLESLGLETQVQTGFVNSASYRRLANDSIYQSGVTLNRPQNIIGRIKGTHAGNALLILSHYDSALVPSYGASDAGSGVATILEVIRAFKAKGTRPKNDIIVLFTDAEEIGLDGAKLFVREHPWAKDVSIALNFEARGSAGPSNMIVETNGGNTQLINAFKDAKVNYPVASSLMYSIYKMLPNDTDSTILREEANIDGFFFAFIDNHFDYHTARDSYENLSRASLMHQGSYLMPLLNYFANANLTTLRDTEDVVYFNFPFIKMVSYPFSWAIPLALLAFVLFVSVLVLGFKKEALHKKDVIKGTIKFVLTLIGCAFLAIFGWKFILWINPQYNEIQQGFPYNGHSYIAMFVLLTLAVLFWVYRKTKPEQIGAFMVAPLLLWWLICMGLSLYLKGGSYFIVPFFFGLLSWSLLCLNPQKTSYLYFVFSVPAVCIFAPLIQFFPVGLGLKMVFISSVFTALLFSYLMPVTLIFKGKKLLAMLLFAVGILFFFHAQSTSRFSSKRQKPNSLVYYQNNDINEAFWLTYDAQLDSWTAPFFKDGLSNTKKLPILGAGSKYGIRYTYAKNTRPKTLPMFEVKPHEDTLTLNKKVGFTICPRQGAHQLQLFSEKAHLIDSLKVNGKTAWIKNPIVPTQKNTLPFLKYWLTPGDSLEVSLSTNSQTLPITVLEYSYDLLKTPGFNLPKRPVHTMPKPFVITDAIIIQQTIDPFQLNPLK